MKFYLGKKMIGEYENGVFQKEVTYSLHRMWRINSWGIDSKTLHKLPAGCVIKIHDIEQDKIYSTTKEHYLENQVYLHFKTEVTDHRSQIFLPLTEFTIETPPVLSEEEKAHQDYNKMFL